MSETGEMQARWRPLVLEGQVVDSDGIGGEPRAVGEILHATREAAVQIGLPPRAFKLFPTVNKARRATFARPWAELALMRRRRDTSEGSIYERVGWPEDWPEGVDRASLAEVRVGFGPRWKPALPAVLADAVLDDGNSREVPADVAETFDLDPVSWVLTPLHDMGASQTIACPCLHVAREMVDYDIGRVLAEAARGNPAGAPPGLLHELVVIEGRGNPENWPGCESAWRACHAYAGPTPAHLFW